MKQIIIFAFFLMFASNSLQAQTITGKVVDVNAQEPLSFANVVLLQATDSAFVKGVVTDENGLFSIILPQQDEKYLLTVSYLGYESQTLDANENDMGIIRLSVNSQVLDEIVVTAPPKIYKMENGGISTNIQNSRLKNLGTATDVLAQLPFVIRNGDNFTVFGKGAPLIYINNRQVRDVSELQELNSSNLKKVTVITNPGAEYDATVKSVIKIETLRPQGEGLSGSATGNIYVDRKFSHSEQINLNYRKKNLDIFGMLRFSQLKDITYNNIEQNTNFTEPILSRFISAVDQYQKRIRTNLGFNYLFGKENSFGVKYELTNNPINHSILHPQTDVYRNNTQTESFTSDWDILNTQNSNYVNAYLNIHPVSWFSAKWDMDYAIGNSTNNQNVLNFYTDSTENIITHSKQNYNLFATKLTMTSDIRDGKLSYGGEYSNTRNQQNFDVNEEGVIQDLLPSNNTTKQNLSAVFVAYNQSFGHFSADLGFRYENTNFEYLVNGIKQEEQSEVYRNWFPSAGVNYSAKSFSASLNYRNTIYRPSYYQLRNSVQYDSPYMYEGGNPYLKPTNINTLSILFMWKDIKLMSNFDWYKNNILFIPEQYTDEMVLVLPVNLENSRNFSTSISYSPTFGIWKPIFESGISKDFLVYEGTAYNQPRYSFSLRNSILLFKSWQLGVDIKNSTTGNEDLDYVYNNFRVNIYLAKSFLNDKLRINLRGNDIFNTDMQKYDHVMHNILSKIRNNYNTQGIFLSITYRFNSTSNKYKGEAASNELNRL